MVQETILTHISIPIELTEEILRWGWLSLTFMQKRFAFMASVALVSKTWLKILIRITCRDIYSYLVHGEIAIRLSPNLHELLPDVPLSQLCHTITRQISAARHSQCHSQYFQGKAIINMLSTLRGLSFMPNLRSLAVEYYHPTFGSFFPFCASIVQLHLEYTFASDCPVWLIHALLAATSLLSLPNVEHISTPVTEDPPNKSIIKVLDLCSRLRLAEESFTIGVHILFSSRLVPENCVLFHGTMPSFNTCDLDNHDFGPKTIRGSAPALVLMKDDDRACEPPLIDLSNMFRDVHIFCHD